MSIHHTDAIIFMGFVDKEGKMLPEHNQIPLEAAKEQPHFFVVVSTCQVTLLFGDHSVEVFKICLNYGNSRFALLFVCRLNVSNDKTFLKGKIIIV